MLFDHAADLRKLITDKLYRNAELLPKRAELADPVVVQKFIDDEHAETTYDPRYAGAYDDRLIHPGNLEDLDRLIATEPWDDAKLIANHQRLYADLPAKTAELKATSDRIGQAIAVADGATSRKLRKKVEDLER